MLDALRLSVGTLTVVPSGAIAEIDRRTAARAMIIAPLAVLPLAAAVAAVGWLGWLPGLPALAVGLFMVGGLALGSRALHLDGLADTVDGFGSGWTAERSLMVMRRGDVGPMGAVALIVYRLAGSLDRRACSGLSGALLVGAAICCSRAALTLTCYGACLPLAMTALGRCCEFGTPPGRRLQLAGVLLIITGAARCPGTVLPADPSRRGRQSCGWRPGVPIRTSTRWCTGT